MKPFQLRLYEDVIAPNHAPVYLPAARRAIFVVRGDVAIEFETGAQHHPAHSAWLGEDDVALNAGSEGATLWRWELMSGDAPTPGEIASAPGASSTLKLAAPIELDPRQRWLMRCDKVQFPPGGVAHTHVHQGPGVRCTLEGEITIETLGASHTHGPGEAWLELGHAPVLAPTTEARDTTFIRCFILPRACRNRSSIRYVNAEDANKNKPQRYHVFGERFISLDAQ
ncbi:hypothetical protein LV28_25155 [Pandoraea pnomenusa]|uniref:Cupin domain-containing protein n=1 Tax=Pandoraea pnomenusa TaxID=93220 RepID=A0A378YDY7_9BURK|nr:MULTISPECIES: hypothetical protein [Pandoraea]AHB78093.1 hypothetical protein X636_23655 [Pandoraea pnomenusa]AHN73611.1 hypothetical protein DA70_03455 [Pandoraea pnomenusa]ALR35903.1 hypothetical protein LV28_25155 [Pandoraea pnomenusa]MBN9092616.1 hypothetical protein [Pandoraea pnomenusa]QDH59995.1 hypothetical protein FKQ53_12335 [Pandoraea pnomenusa]